MHPYVCIGEERSVLQSPASISKNMITQCPAYLLYVALTHKESWPMFSLHFPNTRSVREALVQE